VLTRRSFLGAAVGGTAALAGVRVARAASDDSAAVFAHGVASGDPLPDRVVLWTRVAGAAAPVSVAWEIATDPTFDAIVAAGTVETTGDIDHTVKVDAMGLRSATTHWYRFHAQGVTSPIGRTKTAAAPGSPTQSVRLGVVTCAEYEFGYFGAYRLLAGCTDLDAVLHLGDYVYEFGVGYGRPPTATPTPGPALGRTHVPPHECVTLADYRARYGQYRADPDLRALHAAYPMIVMYDDHEIANDTWRDGAENHQPEEGDWAVRAAAARRTFREWMPIRQVDPVDVGVVHRSFRFGDLVELFMLDVRRYRDKQPANAFFSYGSIDPAITDPKRTMLGVEQRGWLIDGLQRSDASWKVLGNPVPFFPFVVGPPLASAVSDALAPVLDALPPIPPPLTIDDWNGYQAEQHALVDVIAGIEDVVVLTGDYHESFVADVPSRPGDYLVDANSVTVEFIAPAVTSPGLGAVLEARGVPDARAVEALLAANQANDNPWVRYHEPRSNGFGVVELTAERAHYDFWFVDDPLDPSSGGRVASSWLVERSSRRAVAAPGPMPGGQCAGAGGDGQAPPTTSSAPPSTTTPSPSLGRGRLPATGDRPPLGPAAAGLLVGLAAITARRAAAQEPDPPRG
jgi:alkaline phosphatase D